MKNILLLLFTASSAIGFAQRNKGPKMEAITASGYYTTQKGDTIRGDIRTNPEDETEFHTQFFFLKSTGGRLMPINARRAVTYGFENRNFERSEVKGETIFLERIASGRLNLYKRIFHGKIDGIPAIETEYYAQDTQAADADAKLKEVNEISTKFYKKDLKNYLKDQPMIWSDLDKFNFDEQTLVKAFKEFNSYYVKKGN